MRKRSVFIISSVLTDAASPCNNSKFYSLLHIPADKETFLALSLPAWIHRKTFEFLHLSYLERGRCDIIIQISFHSNVCCFCSPDPRVALTLHFTLRCPFSQNFFPGTKFARGNFLLVLLLLQLIKTDNVMKITGIDLFYYPPSIFYNYTDGFCLISPLCRGIWTENQRPPTFLSPVFAGDHGDETSFEIRSNYNGRLLKKTWINLPQLRSIGEGLTDVMVGLWLWKYLFQSPLGTILLNTFNNELMEYYK